MRQRPMTTHSTRRASGEARIGFAIIILLILSASALAQEPAPTPPPYQSLRFEEDYSYLKDKSRRTESLDKLKYIPLGREDFYVSVGGDARLRYETYRNAAFGSGAQDGNGYFLGRFLIHTDWHLGKNFRAFAQVQSGVGMGRNGGPRPTDRDDLDIHQAFFDYKFYEDEKRSLTVRAGRQEAEFGSGRLISASESLNVRRSFDGLRLIYRQGKWTANGMFAKLVSTDRGFFDDAPVSNQTYWGVGGLRSRRGRGGLSVYYLGLDKKSARFDQGTAREIRLTFGSRIWGVFGKFDYNYEAIVQTGSFGAGQINAFALVSDTGFNLPKIRLAPRLGLRASVASGDRDRTDRNLQSFNPLFPSTAYSGAVALVGPTNIMDFTPSVRLNPTKKITLSLETAFYWRQSLADGLYGTNVNLQRTGNLSRERLVGGLPSARLDYRVNRHFTYTAVYSHFFPGKFLQETPPGEDVDYLSTWLNYRF
jgi:hypothetical protein